MKKSSGLEKLRIMQTNGGFLSKAEAYLWLKHIYGPTVLGTIVSLKSGNPAVT